MDSELRAATLYSRFSQELSLPTTLASSVRSQYLRYGGYW